MPGVSKRRRKIKEAALLREEAKRNERIIVALENEDQDVAEPNSVAVKLKPGRKKSQKEERNFVITRQVASVLEVKEKENEKQRKRTQNYREKIAENREIAKETAKKRRDNCVETHRKIKIRRQEEIIKQQEGKINELQEEIESSAVLPSLNSGVSTSSAQLSSINTEEIMHYKSALSVVNLDVHDSTSIKNDLNLSERKYDLMRTKLIQKGINMPSTSTIKRNENRIFNELYQHSDKPDLYGLIEKAVMKHDFTGLENVRITLGGDGGGDAELSSVKVGFFFNDIVLPLSVKKFLIIWSYVGKESWELLKPVLKSIDDDVIRLKQNGIMTKSGLKPVIITYVGDIKFQSTSLSLQGGYAVYGCPKCVTKRVQWASIKSEDIVLRTIANIIECAEEVVNNNGQPRNYASVFNFPLLRNIEITNFVPPPVHILISLVIEIIVWIRRIKGETYLPLEDFLNKSGAKRDPRTKAYNGNGCRKILSHFRESTPNRIIYDGYGKELFEAASNIEKFAIARPLLDAEIDELESYINLFFNLVKEYGSDAVKFFLNKTKIHMLKEHVVPFVRIFGSWGLFSEESVESIHHVRNDLDDRVPGTGPAIDLKRTNFFLKTKAVALNYS